MHAYICTGCSDEPCYFMLNDTSDPPELCPYGDLADWKEIDIKDVISVLEAE